MYTVNLIGCGRVGKTLASLVHQKGAGLIQGLYSRSSSSSFSARELIGVGHVVTTLKSMRSADIWIIAVPDSQILTVANSLAVVSDKIDAPTLKKPVAFHCSGFEPSALLDPLRRKGFAIASVHPALSFADPAVSLTVFNGTPCAIEGEADSVAILFDWIERIGGVPFDLLPENKRLYHAAAVFSSNLNVVLQAIAKEAWQSSGVPQNIIPGLHAALLRATTQNVLELGPHLALTGPAARGDQRVVSLQQDTVQQWHPEAGQAYALLSKMATRLAQTGITLADKPS